ncbi:MAG: hypothetical protein PHI89_05235 [Thiovulaceae bacterium]|nr:hypothetical protein [Sulfurimonadaceae bacterium]
MKPKRLPNVSDVSNEIIDAKNHIHLENIGRVGMEFLVDSARVH